MLKFIILASCVANRLQNAFCHFPIGGWQCIPVPMIFTITKQKDLVSIASKALECDLVFTQPLFNYAECNTENLRKHLNSKLITFSSPEFTAYSPDIFTIPKINNEKFSTPLEWHSKIIVLAYFAKVHAGDFPDFYLQHKLFSAHKTKENLEKSLHQYRIREQNVEIGTFQLLKQHFTEIPLFHSNNHPHSIIPLPY